MTETVRPDVLQEQMTVSVRGDDYVFRIPSIRYDIEVGYRAAAIRRKADPEGGGSLFALDNTAAVFARFAAVMELYLVAGPKWPFSSAPDGKPVVNHEKFPRNKTQTLWEVGEAFQKEFERFRDDRVIDDQPVGTEAVAGERHPGA